MSHRKSRPSAATESLRTSREVFHQILWDPRYEPGAFVMGVEERFAGPKEIPLPQFVPDGEIPWHRVWYIRCGETYVWDRKERVDRIQNPDQAPPAPWKSLGLRASHEADLAANREPSLPPSQPSYGFDPATQRWLPAEHVPSFGESPDAFAAARPAPLQGEASSENAGEGTDAPSLRVVTWNVLFDWFVPEQLYSEERWERLFGVLGSCDADLIALQEVTPSMLQRLLAQRWVREGYWVSERSDGPEVRPVGQVWLSRWPFRSRLLSFADSKKTAVLVECVTPQWQGGVAVVHLSSNREENAEERRMEQLGALLAVQRHPHWPADLDWLLVGDFNLRENDPLEAMAREHHLLDVWTHLRPDDPGHTFVPAHNTLAALNSRSGRSGRLDRMVLSPSSSLRPQAVELLGQEPYTQTPEPRFLSDHAGLCVTFSIEQAEQPGATSEAEATEFWVEPTVRSALTVIPPEELWGPIQAIRREYDRSFVRWMPHINVLYGFVPDAHFAAAASALAKVLREVPPFSVTLETLEVFEHRKSATVWLRPVSDPPGMLEEVQRRVQEVFPLCSEQSERSEHGYAPHLTVASLRGALRREAATLLRAWREQWTPLTFRVEQLHLISRQEDRPFVIRESVALPGSSSSGLSHQSSSGLSRWERLAQMEETLASLRTSCEGVEQALGEEASVLQPYGSFVLGAVTEDSDLDLAWLLPATADPAVWMEVLLRRLELREPSSRPHGVSGMELPTLRLRREALEVEIVALSLPEGVASWEAVVASWEGMERLEPATVRVWQALADVHVLREHLAEHLDLEVFADILVAVKRWAAARGVLGQAFGFLGGMAWSVLVACGCRAAIAMGVAPTADALLPALFAWLAELGGAEMVSLVAPTPTYERHPRRDWLVVLSLAPPVANLARMLTESTWRVVQKEWNEATGLLKAGFSWDDVMADAQYRPLTEGFGSTLALTLRAANPDRLRDVVGWLRGRFLAWLVDIEDRTALRCRPIPRVSVQEDGTKATLQVAFAMASSVLDRSEVLKAFDKTLTRLWEAVEEVYPGWGQGSSAVVFGV